MTLTGALSTGRLNVGQLACRINLRPRAGAAASSIGYLYLSGEKNEKPKSGWDYFSPTLFYCPKHRRERHTPCRAPEDR